MTRGVMARGGWGALGVRPGVALRGLPSASPLPPPVPAVALLCGANPRCPQAGAKSPALLAPAALTGGGKPCPGVPRPPPTPRHPRGDRRSAAPLLRAGSPPPPPLPPATSPSSRGFGYPGSPPSPSPRPPAPEGPVPGAMLPGGSPPQHASRRCRRDGGSKSARRSPTSALPIGSGAPHPAHWRCRRRPALHKAPLGRAGPVGSRGAAKPGPEPGGAARRGERCGMRSRRRGGAGHPPWPVSLGGSEGGGWCGLLREVSRGLPARGGGGGFQLRHGHRPGEKLVAGGAGRWARSLAPQRGGDAGWARWEEGG